MRCQSDHLQFNLSGSYMKLFYDGAALMLKNTVCSTLNNLNASCVLHIISRNCVTNFVRMWCLTACDHVLCINISLRPCFSHPLSSSRMCVILCFYSIPPVFHAHLLIPISTGRENPHSLDGSRGDCLQKVHVSQWRVELRYCHVGSDVIWRAAILGHEQSRCK